MSAAAANARNNRETTRQQLIEAAEKLFAESGIDAVSLRQINVAAGQKNSSAAHYHFGSKAALILSIYQRRMESVNKLRETQIKKLEDEKRTNDVRGLIQTIVDPIVAEIDADESGQHYISFMAQAMGHPQLDPAELQRQEHTGGLFKTIKYLGEALPHVPRVLLGQRFGLAFEQIIHSLADREKLRQSVQNTFEIDAALFVSNLIDVIAGAMSAPVSEQTARQLERLTEKQK
jgi:AcrR family transcriptional regulator